MPGKQAAAFTLLLPAGSATEPEEFGGISGVLEGLCFRGAGGRDARQLSDALDDLGIDRGGGADVEYTTFGGATLALYLADSLRLFADIVLRPALPENDWEAQRDLALQALDSLDDSPPRKMMVRLRRDYFQDGYGRSPAGTREGLRALNIEALRADHAARYRPEGAILAVGGQFDFEAIADLAEELFGAWSGSAPAAGVPRAANEPFFHHIEQDSAQQQIGVVYRGVASTDADFYAYRIANAILSGGMGARLFTEVREKRGLVYSVSASAASHRSIGYTVAYAGTTPERAQETLNVLLGELVRMKDGVTEDEVERAKIGMLSGLIMSEESSRARTGAIARDQWMLGRVRPLEEVTAAVNAITPSDIVALYERHPAEGFSVVTLGPAKLRMPILVGS